MGMIRPAYNDLLSILFEAIIVAADTVYNILIFNMDT